MNARLAGGLAAAALVGAGLACPGAATAADPTGFPQELGFAPTTLVATDDAVYAAGVTEDGTGHVAEVGGDDVVVGTDLYSVKMALDPASDALEVVTSSETGEQSLTVDTTDFDASAPTPLPDQSYTDVLASDSAGVFTVRETGSDLDLTTSTGQVTLDDQSFATAGDARGAAGARTWYVGGGRFGTPNTATVWTYDEATEATDSFVVGPQGDPDNQILDLDVATDGTVYTLSYQDQDDAPQSYGIGVAAGTTQTYVPLRYPATDLAVSPDGATLYVAQSDSVLAVPTTTLTPSAGYPEDRDGLGSVSLDSSVATVVVDPAGHVFAAADSTVAAWSTPGAPTGLVAATQPEWTDYAEVSWTAPTVTGGVDPEWLGYDLLIVDRAGGVIEDRIYYGTRMDLYGLTAGHTYDVSVATTNGLFGSGDVTTAFTVPTPAPPVTTPPVTTPPVTTPPVTTPPAPAPPAPAPAAPIKMKGSEPTIDGKAKVGKMLTVDEGTWTKGADFSYQWEANGKAIKGADKPKLKLTKALKGKRISVEVTGTKAGYTTLSKTSDQTGKVKR